MRNWYTKDRRFIRATFDSDWMLVASLLAATSPRVHVATSWQWAMDIYHQFKAGKQPDLSKYYPCHKANIRRALAGQPLSGDKVSAFYENLIGNLDAVTIDTWMLRLFNWFRKDEKRHNPEGGKYRQLAKVFRTVARHNGFAPAEFQAILWTHYRQTRGYKPTSYSEVGTDKRQGLFAFAEQEKIPF